jgi:hypothetical protein
MLKLLQAGHLVLRTDISFILLNDPVDVVIPEELTKDFELGIVPSPSDVSFKVTIPWRDVTESNSLLFDTVDHLTQGSLFYSNARHQSSSSS